MYFSPLVGRRATAGRPAAQTKVARSCGTCALAIASPALAKPALDATTLDDTALTPLPPSLPRGFLVVLCCLCCFWYRPSVGVSRLLYQFVRFLPNLRPLCGSRSLLATLPHG